MSRTVTAWVTCGADRLGVVGPFAVDVPWWAEVEPVVAHLRHVLGVPVLVLRLLTVEGAQASRDGHVTYHVEALERPAPGPLIEWPERPGDHATLTGPQELRSPWATMDGLGKILGWASDALAAAGRPATGPVQQRKTWNLAGLFVLPTGQGPVWLKATPAFATDEAAVIDALARVDPGLVPTVIAADQGRMLLEQVPGEDCWDATDQTIAGGIGRFVAAQAALADAPDELPPGLPDRRTPVLAELVGELLDGPLADELTPDELTAARALADRWPMLADCGLPDTLVHGDFHSGNWRGNDPHLPPVVMDFADAHLGNPVLDGLRARDFLPPAKRAAATRAWTDAWAAHVPGSRPDRALIIAEPLAHLTYAVRYQEFLDGIEPSERIYHHGDPAAAIRAALRCGMAGRL
jgi:Ser/Thr protein kinase RdoA (MazF antagonist)